jgi:hypothetical protein
VGSSGEADMFTPTSATTTSPARSRTKLVRYAPVRLRRRAMSFGGTKLPPSKPHSSSWASHSASATSVSSAQLARSQGTPSFIANTHLEVGMATEAGRRERRCCDTRNGGGARGQRDLRK